MITNANLTIYHKGIDPETRLETWTRYYYPHCWWFDAEGTTIFEGYQRRNKVEVRIPYETNENLNIANFEIGDIICKGEGQNTIQSQSDVPNAYNIIQITNNSFGENAHIHLGGS